MAAIRISEAEAAGDFAGLIARARSGAEFVIEKDAGPAVLLRVAGEGHLRRLSESLRMARENGSKVTLDAGFAADLDAVDNDHPEPLESLWD
jgi:hypothetical protein